MTISGSSKLLGDLELEGPDLETHVGGKHIEDQNSG
jgi:hypothetical protein